MSNCKFCGKECKNENSLRNHERLCKSNPNRQTTTFANLNKANEYKKTCIHCGKKFSIGNIEKHEKACSNNPANQKECPVCGTKHSKKGATCSYSCANKLFRTGENNGNWNPDSYRTTCFAHHKKECVVCGESKIVEVHHMNEDKSDNRPENLVPLCPTHHQYFHSKYRNEVEPKIRQYLCEYLGVA